MANNNPELSQAEAFLRRRLAGTQGAEACGSVVRGARPNGVAVSPEQAYKAAPSSVVRMLEPLEEEVDDVPGCKEEMEKVPVIAWKTERKVPLSKVGALPWWTFLRWPWSGAWRWVLGLGGGLCMALGLLMVVVPGTHALYTAAMAACVPVAMVTLFCELEVTRRVNWAVALLVTVVGGALSILFTFVFIAITGIDSVFLAGLIEEPAKGAVLLALLLAFPDRFPGVLSGLALGVCVGAGFATIETVGYAYTFGETSAPSTAVLLLRGALSPFAHMGWTGALGGAMWMARARPAQAWVAWAVLGGMIAAHCLWNTLGPITYCAIGLWALIFHYVKRGIGEAAAWGYAVPPKGV